MPGPVISLIFDRSKTGFRTTSEPIKTREFSVFITTFIFLRTESISGTKTVSFICRQCGECCSSMGEIIEIREVTGPLEFRIGFSATGEERMVTVDPDKRDLFLSKDTVTERHIACPFLREKVPGTVICTVHDSRPDLCRQYSCYRILVLDPEGKRIGRVHDASRYFTSSDDKLRELWKNEIAGREIADESLWEEEVSRIIVQAGYRVVR